MEMDGADLPSTSPKLKTRRFQFKHSKIADILALQGKPKKKKPDSPVSPNNVVSHIEKLKTEITQLRNQMESEKRNHNTQIEALKKEFEEWKYVREKEIGELKAMVYKANFQKIFTAPKLVSERDAPMAAQVEEIIVVKALQPTEEFSTVVKEQTFVEAPDTPPETITKEESLAPVQSVA